MLLRSRSSLFIIKENNDSSVFPQLYPIQVSQHSLKLIYGIAPYQIEPNAKAAVLAIDPKLQFYSGVVGGQAKK